MSNPSHAAASRGSVAISSLAGGAVREPWGERFRCAVSARGEV